MAYKSEHVLKSKFLIKFNRIVISSSVEQTCTDPFVYTVNNTDLFVFTVNNTVL